MLDGFLLLAPFLLALVVGLSTFVGCSVKRSGLAEPAEVVFQVAFDTEFAPDVTAFRALVTITFEGGGEISISPVTNRGEPAEIRDGKFVLDDFDPVGLGPGPFLLTCEVFERASSGDVPPEGLPPVIESRTPCRLDLSSADAIVARFENLPGDRFFLGCEAL